MNNADNTIVIGGGLAGIAAAVKLAQTRQPVTLVETRKRLGGRATSFVDPTTGQVLDNCQHVLLGCCTNLIDLYQRLGVENKIDWHSTLYFQNADGVLDILEANDVPAPFHLSSSFLMFKQLSLKDKIAIGRAVMSLMRMGKKGRAKWHDRSFADWLTSQKQTPNAIRIYWQNIAVSALNATIDRMAADYALQVFQEGFCASEQASLMGLSRVPLVELYDRAADVIEAAGGKVLLGESADSLTYEAGKVTQLNLSDGQTLTADRFISAVPFDRLLKLSSEEMVAADARLRGLNQINVSPIIGIHLWYPADQADQPVMTLPHLVLTQSPIHWIFNKGMDPEQGGQHLHVVISAADDLVDKPASKIESLIADEVAHALPAARGRQPGHIRVVKEKRATFAITPGVDQHRASAVGAIDNLLLAGDWCLSGWPATMEGAVRSGYIAAGHAMQPGGEDEEHVVADLESAMLYKLIGLAGGNFSK